MRNRQRGITTIGFVIIAILVVAIGFAALKMTPVYLEHMKIVSVLEDVKKNLDGTNPSIQLIKAGIGKRLNIEMVSTVQKQDFKIKKTEVGYSVRVQYDRETPYIANVFLLARFNNAVEIRR